MQCAILGTITYFFPFGKCKETSVSKQSFQIICRESWTVYCRYHVTPIALRKAEKDNECSTLSTYSHVDIQYQAFKPMRFGFRWVQQEAYFTLSLTLSFLCPFPSFFVFFTVTISIQWQITQLNGSRKGNSIGYALFGWYRCTRKYLAHLWEINLWFNQLKSKQNKYVIQLLNIPLYFNVNIDSLIEEAVTPLKIIGYVISYI